MQAVHTLPRELPARYVKAGDEVAMYEADRPEGEPVPVYLFARSEGFVQSAPSAVDWFLVVEGAELVAPPAAPDEVPPRPEGVVRYGNGGTWRVQQHPRPFVPDGIDHVATHRLTIAPIDTRRRVGVPIVVYADEAEQFVIRERVQVREGQPAAPAGITRDRGTSAVLALVERSSVPPPALPPYRCPRIERHEAHEWTDRSHVGPKASYECDGEGHANVRAVEAARDEADRGSAGPDVTAQLPMRRLPMGVLGVPMGHGIAATDRTWEYTRADTEE